MALKGGATLMQPLANKLVRVVPGHLREAVADGLDCHLQLCDGTGAAVRLLVAEARARVPRWPNEAIASLEAGMIAVGLLARAAASVTGSGDLEHTVNLLGDADQRWAEAHGTTPATASTWVIVLEDARREQASDGDVLELVTERVGGAIGALLADLTGRCSRSHRHRARIGVPLVRSGRVGPATRSVLQVRLQPGTGMVVPSLAMALVPEDASFRSALNDAKVAAGLPASRDAVWTLDSPGRRLIGRSAGGAAAVAMLSVVHGVRLDAPHHAVTGAAQPNGRLVPLHSDASLSLELIERKLAAYPWIVVPAGDKDALREAFGLRPGIRFVDDVHGALRLVRRASGGYRRRMAAGTAALTMVLTGTSWNPSPLTSGKGPAPTTTAQPTTTVPLTRAGPLVGTISLPADRLEGMSLAGDSIALIDETDVIIANHAGGALRSFLSPAITPQGLGWDGSHYWVEGAGSWEIVRFRVEGRGPDQRAVVANRFRSPSTLTGNHDMAWDGEGMWLADGREVIRLNSLGAVTDRFTAQHRVDAIAWDGNHLWLAFRPNMVVQLQEVDRDGNPFRTLDPPIGRVEGMDWRDGELWVAAVAYSAPGSFQPDKWLMYRVPT